MKKFSINTLKKHDEALKSLKHVKKTFEDSIMDSKTFAEQFEPYIRNIALFKEVKGRKFFRSQEYASIGIMDRNDLIQEAYLHFLEAYGSVDWKTINKSTNPDAELWAYLKKRTVFRLQSALWEKKDGIRLTDHAIKKAKREMKTDNMKVITSLFSQLERVFFRNQEETSLTRWETDLLGYFFDVHFDNFLDLDFKGNRNVKGIERSVLKSFYGLDEIRMTTKEIANYYYVSDSTIKNIIKRAIKKLRSEDSKRIISDFCREYSLNTQADINNIKINH